MGSGVTCGGSAYALYGLGVGPPSRAAQATPRAGHTEAAEDDVVRPREHASARAALACASGLQSTTERDLGPEDRASAGCGRGQRLTFRGARLAGGLVALVVACALLPMASSVGTVEQRGLRERETSERPRIT